MDALSISGRALDTLKLGIAALAVFLVGNYVNFQPWDRDNCKLFYIWVFVASMLSGALLAAPVEALLGWLPGSARMMQVTGSSPRAIMDVALGHHAVAAAAGAAAATGELRVFFSIGAEVCMQVWSTRGGGCGCVGVKESVLTPIFSVLFLSSSPFPFSPHAGKSGASFSPSSAAVVPRHRASAVVRTASLAGMAAAAVAIFYLTCTGFMMVVREYGQYHVVSSGGRGDCLAVSEVG